ncbi:MAG: tetratricopeptide repeat protein, partial [Bryobacterales bacterium]|nr:tetratricopeptide repeat protein [Bryobacterales bacterium]
DDWNLLTRLAYLEEPERALALYERSLKLRPQQPVALVNAGTILARQGRLAQAMEYWRRALAMNPGLTEASRNLAMALRAAGRRDEADQVLRNAKWFAPGVDQ